MFTVIRTTRYSSELPKGGLEVYLHIPVVRIIPDNQATLGGNRMLSDFVCT